MSRKKPAAAADGPKRGRGRPSNAQREADRLAALARQITPIVPPLAAQAAALVVLSKGLPTPPEPKDPSPMPPQGPDEDEPDMTGDEVRTLFVDPHNPDELDDLSDTDEIVALFIDPEDEDDDPLYPPVADAEVVVEIEAGPDLTTLSAGDRENPDKLWGQVLRDFAHRMGIAKSMMSGWTDAKVRDQIRIYLRRRYEELEEA